MKKKAILFWIIGIISPFLAYGVYRAIVIQFTICAPVYNKLQNMSTDVNNERLNLEYIYFSDNCR